MFQLKILLCERKLDIPVYSLSGKKTNTNTKSCFIDSNRVDTVKASRMLEEKKNHIKK